MEALFAYYRSASRPTLRRIAELIPQSHPGTTGSPETVRRTLLGLSIPANWHTVDAILTVLCDLAQIDPDAPTRPAADDPWAIAKGNLSAPRTEIKRLWHAVFDTDPQIPWQRLPDAEHRRRPRPGSTPWDDDPWARAEPPSYSDEPPF